jgi:hypothetical protein
MLVHTERFVARAERGETWAHVQRVRLPGDEVSGAVDAVRALMAQMGATVASWWLSEHTAREVDRELLANGLTVEDDDYEIDGLLLTAEPPPGPPDVDARRLTTEDEVAAAQELQWDVFGIPADRRRPHRVDEDTRVYGAWIDGRFAGAGRSYFSPVGAMLAGGATADWARGRGAYRALVRTRWDDAVAHGTPALGVHAKDTSSPILRRLGFEQVHRFRRLQDVRSEG